MTRQSQYDDESEEFEFTTDDTVLVRVRENKTSGPLRAKFVAFVVGFTGPLGPARTGSDRVVLSPPWSNSTTSGIPFKSYEAEFEVIESPEEAEF